MESRKVLISSSNSRVSTKKNVKKPPVKTSTPVKESPSVIEPNISHILTESGSRIKTLNQSPKSMSLSEPNISQIGTMLSATSKMNAESSRSDKENVKNWENTEKESGEIDPPMFKLKAAMLQRASLFNQQKEQLQEINNQIKELRERLEEEKKEVHATITALKHISNIEARYNIEKEKELLVSDSDEHIQEYFDQFMTVINQERSKLELKNIASITDDKFKKLLSTADSSFKLFNEGQDHEAVQKLASFLPALEESLEKCCTSNQKCDEITKSIQRLLLHRSALNAINQSNS